MDKLLVSPLSTPSTKSSTKSSQSGHTLGEPRPPIDPPCRRSSLAFSQIVQPEIVPDHAQQPVESKSVPPPMSTPACASSNVGKERRTTAFLQANRLSDHSVQMQKVFQNARANLQLDVAFASSPAGSIESRLPSIQNPDLPQAVSCCASIMQHEGALKARNWRYSTAPGSLAQAHLDVREPFPDNSPLLPELPSPDVSSNIGFAAEPVSSGFTSPISHETSDNASEIGALLPPLPDTSPADNHSGRLSDSLSRDSPLNPSHRAPMPTMLDRQLAQLQVSPTEEGSCDQFDESPIVTHLRSRPNTMNLENFSIQALPDHQIFLSTPAKAAAESARAKRGMPRSALQSIDKENIAPGSLSDDPGVHENVPLAQCPDPGVHRCPNPNAHNFQTGMSTPGAFGPSSAHCTPNFNIYAYRLSPSPLRASLHPPAPHYRCADSNGSPLPILKVKSPSTSPDQRVYPPRQSYYPPAHHRYGPAPSSRSLQDQENRVTHAEHFQPGWYHMPLAEERATKPNSLTYAFSTAAAKVVGSSSAPDSRIRDSYRTDTLTPLVRPASRFRKNGIGAVATRAKGRYYANSNYSPWPPVIGPRPAASMRLGTANSKQPLLVSSPLEPATCTQLSPKLRCPSHVAGEDSDIAEDNGATASVPGTVAEEMEPMEVDEDIRAAVRMSIVGVPDCVTEDTGMPEQEPGEPKAWSPNVTPFRKGKGMKIKRPRTASYWDQDLPAVRSMDRSRGKRFLKVLDGRRGVKSMRISGLRSSPAQTGTRSEGRRTVDMPLAFKSDFEDAGVEMVETELQGTFVDRPEMPLEEVKKTGQVEGKGSILVGTEATKMDPEVET